MLVLQFVLIACDSTPVEEESESLQQTKTAKPDDPVVVNTDDQDLSVNQSEYWGHLIIIVIDTSPVVNFISDENKELSIHLNDGGKV